MPRSSLTRIVIHPATILVAAAVSAVLVSALVVGRYWLIATEALCIGAVSLFFVTLFISVRRP